MIYHYISIKKIYLENESWWIYLAMIQEKLTLSKQLFSIKNIFIISSLTQALLTCGMCQTAENDSVKCKFYSIKCPLINKSLYEYMGTV